MATRSVSGWPRGCYNVIVAYNYQQKCSLVNLKLKWVKDRTLDSVVVGQNELKAACMLVAMIAKEPGGCRAVYHLARKRRQIGLPFDLKLSTFVRRYPTVFEQFYARDSGGTPVPWYRLTTEAQCLQQQLVEVLKRDEADLVDRLCKFLMLTRDKILPLQTIDQLKWDLGLPYDYHESLIPHHPDKFAFVPLPDDRVGLKLLKCDESLAVSQLQLVNSRQRDEDKENNSLAFPISFTRGFGLKRKCMKWLEEWQKLPYTSPYIDASHLDPRTDVSEKRIVGVFHELLHLTVQKKTERKNVSNLRKPLAMPQKFTKVFERHPGIFYISMKGNTQTVVLREGYVGGELINKHPLVKIREKFSSIMKKGVVDRSRGLYKAAANDKLVCGDELSKLHDQKVWVDGHGSDGESEWEMFPEYNSDEVVNEI
uniref:PORR domain-containing protein n=1 Tax=Kalanchoe fedtschenkoi TaxID=63787 RepID=A0A7N0UCC5_KALFE